MPGIVVVLGVLLSNTGVVCDEYPPVREFFAQMRTTLDAEELREVLDAWDRLAASAHFRDRDRAVYSVARRAREAALYGRDLILAYDNPEVVERVVALYLEECAKYDVPFSRDDVSDNPWHAEGEDGEAAGEYLDALMTVAESTFDPRLHPYELRILSAVGSYRETYLAVVEPEKTLQCILDANRGFRGGRFLNADALYFEHEDLSTSFCIDAAFRILAMMKKEAPEVLKAYRSRVLEFVRAHALHFAAPRQVPYHTDLRRMHWHDFYCRAGAYDVLELLGDADDLDFAQCLSEDPPDPTQKGFVASPWPYHSRESLVTKAARVIAKLQEVNVNPTCEGR